MSALEEDKETTLVDTEAASLAETGHTTPQRMDPDHSPKPKATPHNSEPLHDHTHRSHAHDHTHNTQDVGDKDFSLDEQSPLFDSATPKLNDTDTQLSSPLKTQASTSGHSSRNGSASHYSSSPLPPPVQGETFSTPTSIMSLLGDIQPPTPFQHAAFDLDSSPEEDLLSPSHHSTIISQGERDSILLDLQVGGSAGGSSEALTNGSAAFKTPQPIVATLVDFSTLGKDLKASPLLTSTAHQSSSQQLEDVMPSSGGVLVEVKSTESQFTNTSKKPVIAVDRSSLPSSLFLSPLPL